MRSFDVNPWTQLPEAPPYWLPNDQRGIREFNELCESRHRHQHRIQEESLPEPYLGNPLTARVVLLSLNPGHDEGDASWHDRSDFRAALRATLEHTNVHSPFYLLDPGFAKSPGGKYWGSRLRCLRQIVGLAAIQKNVAVNEWYPYHSERFGFTKKLMSEAQDYSFELVRKAASDPDRMIVILRGGARWQASVSALQRFFIVNSVRNCVISPRNLASGVFDEICKTLQS